jgi:putative hydrolase of the HAD superfamily
MQLIDEFNIQNVSADELLHDYIKNFHHHCIAFPNLFKMLHQLKAQKYKLGIITNGKGQFQMDNIIALGLEEMMDTILISEWEGIKKKNPEIFERALEKLQVHAFESIYVGDHPENDIKADCMIGDLLDLPLLLNNIIM